VERKLAKWGLSDDEAQRWLAAHPGIAGGYFYASLIYESQVAEVLEFPYTLELAKNLDELSQRLLPFIDTQDATACLEVLNDSAVLTDAYFAPRGHAEPNGLEDVRTALANKPDDPLAFLRVIGTVSGNALFSLLASWDVEFTCRYFSGRQPCSLFVKLMPRIDAAAWDGEADAFATRRDYLHRPIRRLLDLTWFIGRWTATPQCVAPSDPPSVATLAGDSGIDSKKLIKWRTGTADLSSAQFGYVWTSLVNNLREVRTEALRRDDAARSAKSGDKTKVSQGMPMTPYPLYVAATFWNELLVNRSNRRDKLEEIYLFQEDYLAWWKHHCQALAARDRAFGDKPWPGTLDHL